MPFTNPFLKAVSSLDPCNRKTSVALELMKELPLYASNVVQYSEKEAYDLEIHNFQNVHFSDIVEESVDLWWIDVENTSKYPLLSRMTFALLTCFHEPKVESSFSIMNNVITPGSNTLNVETFNHMRITISKLLAKFDVDSLINFSCHKKCNDSKVQQLFKALLYKNSGSYNLVDFFACIGGFKVNICQASLLHAFWS
ncbi:hypothetical protein AVEN_77349-1 [Araneus ventricosus]|uniref:HAT C-terminal dimerisation domain-containing protein n=1 Tax=Araneus ventricosus TaxID=182803 RepID=A0A4Y2C9V5_ARAVE|nr:hypothetical protein AVEN_77349-1 [Araneus ventricosus]